MSLPSRTSYDEVPYDSYPYEQTHPEHLSVTASLLGLKPARIEGCRVLELGCASGGNLIPMALTLPGASFLGIDLSARQIEEGCATVAALGLQNVELCHRDILAVGPDLGRFDYIICHGVYSWVPRAVQDKILEVCARHLAPQGVAYVSYNTYPGWHMRGMIRDIMCYHAQDFAAPLVRVKHARNLLDFLSRSVADPQGAYGLLLRSEAEMIRNKADSYLFHDHMEEVNDPVYFHQFAERAEAQGLHFLGEADLQSLVAGSFPPEVENVLRAMSADRIRMEQYKDFLTNRTFRQTLLTVRPVVPQLALRQELLQSLWVASPAKPESAAPDVAAAAVERFVNGGTVLHASVPFVKAAMMVLVEAWPGYVPFARLQAEARKRCGTAESADGDAEELGQFLLSTFASAANRLVELHLQPPAFALTVAERPRAAALARHQAEAGRRVVTSLRHGNVALDDFDRTLLTQLDGQTERSALIARMREAVERGDFTLEIDGQAPRSPAELTTALTEVIERRLEHLAANALLAL